MPTYQTTWFLLLATLLSLRPTAAEQPSVTREEARLLEKVSAVAETNAPAALRLLETVRRDEDAGAALDYTAGNLYSRMSQDAAAADAYRMAITKHPGFVAAQAGLGRALAAQSEWRESERVLSPLASAADAGRNVLLLYGHVLLELGRTISAELVYRRILQSDQDTSDALYGLARCYLLQNRFLEGTAVLEELVRQQPRNHAAWALLADMWLARERPERALMRLETARRLNAATAPMLAQLGDLYVNQDLTAIAAEVYREALQMTTEPDDLLLRAAEGLSFGNAPQEAGELLDQYLTRVAEPETRYYRVRAQWAEQTGQTSAAREAYHAWIERDPLNMDALLALGDRYQTDGEPETAELWYERARDAHPRHPAPLIRLAHLAVARRAFAEAIDLLERAHVHGGDPAVGRSIQQIRRLQELARE